jgi:hypothetical protein
MSTLNLTAPRDPKLLNGQGRQPHLRSSSLVVHRLALEEPMAGEGFPKSTLRNLPTRMNREENHSEAPRHP